MLEKELIRYPFFNKVGAYSIDPENYESIMESLDYTHTLIQNPENIVVLYPQGRIEPYDKRPVELKKGWLRIIRKSPMPISVLPAAFKIQYTKNRLPDIFCRFGDVFISRNAKEDHAVFQNSFNENVFRLDEAAHADSCFENIFHGRLT